MNRLTLRNKLGLAFYTIHGTEYDRREKLASLEDKIESRELVEVVRCYQCKHGSCVWETCYNEPPQLSCVKCKLKQIDVDGNGFCECGERKEDLDE